MIDDGEYSSEGRLDGSPIYASTERPGGIPARPIGERNVSG